MHICHLYLLKVNRKSRSFSHKQSSQKLFFNMFMSERKSYFVLLSSVYTEISCIPELYLEVCSGIENLNLRE